MLWSQSPTTNAAIFAGTDGTVDAYVVSLGTSVATSNLIFNSTGYKITGSTLAITNGAANGPITVAAGKTATINSTLRYNHNVATPVTLGSAGGVLNLGGGTTPAFNPQWNFSGAGTVNFTAGTFTSNIGNVNTATNNLTGGTYNYTPGNGAGATIGNNISQDVSYTVSGTGTLTCNNNAASGTGTSLSYLGLGFSNGVSKATLTLKTGGTVTIGTGKHGELQIARNGDANAQLDVQGGSFTVDSGTTVNKIYIFKAGANASRTASMTQSGGTVTANGIQFGSNAGAYDPTAQATLQLSGGRLYVGTQGITRGSSASALPVTIQLQGGTLGASANWSSSLDMKLGTTGGGVTILAADSAAVARNITLSGLLSDDGAVNGQLTKTGAGTLTLSGANTYSGATVVSAGTLLLGNPSAVSISSALTIADAAALSLTTTTSTVPNLTFANTGTLNFNIVGGGSSLIVSALNGVTNSGAAGSVTINITGSAPASGTYTLISYSGSLQGSGFSAYKLGTFPAGKSYSLANAAGAVQLVVAEPSYWTGAQSSEWSTNIIAGSKNWTLGVFGAPADFLNGSAVVLDDTASTYTVDVSVADVTPTSVLFDNSGTAYTLQGSKAIAGSASLTKQGSQTLTILNANTYTGATTISAGTLQLGASNVLPDGAGTGNVTNNGTLDLNTFSDAINGLSGSGTVDTVAGGTSTLTVGNGDGSGTFSGIIQNTAGTLALIKTGTNTQVLQGANTFTGGVTIKNGTLESKTTQTTLGTGTVVLGGAGSTNATFITGQNNTNSFIINAPSSGTNVIGANGIGSGFTLSGPMTLNGDLILQNYPNNFAGGFNSSASLSGGVTGTGNLMLNNLGNNTNFINLSAAAINHSGTITVQGQGLGNVSISAVIGSNVTGVTQNSATSRLILSATNTYSGDTTINSGTLRLAAGGSIGNSANIIVGTVPGSAAILDASVAGITIGAGQTLKGYGTVTGSVTNDGTLVPGTSIGTLTFGGNLTLNAGSTNKFEVNGSTPTNDVVILGSTMTYGGVLGIVPSGTFTAGQTFRLFSGAGATNASNFSSISGSPGSGLGFAFTNGVLTVFSTAAPSPTIAPVTVSGTNLVVSVPTTSGYNYVLQSATNLTPAITWMNESTNAGTGGNLLLYVPIEPGKPLKFLRFWVY